MSAPATRRARDPARHHPSRRADRARRASSRRSRSTFFDKAQSKQGEARPCGPGACRTAAGVRVGDSATTAIADRAAMAQEGHIVSCRKEDHCCASTRSPIDDIYVPTARNKTLHPETVRSAGRGHSGERAEDADPGAQRRRQAPRAGRRAAPAGSRQMARRKDHRRLPGAGQAALARRRARVLDRSSEPLRRPPISREALRDAAYRPSASCARALAGCT